MHKVELWVSLVGSVLFDWHMEATARGLCSRFPGLKFEWVEGTPKKIHIYGELNDYWYDVYQREVFEIGAVKEQAD